MLENRRNDSRSFLWYYCLPVIRTSPYGCNFLVSGIVKKREDESSRSSGSSSFHQKARLIRLSVNAVVVNLAVRRILAFPRNEGSTTVIGHGFQNSRCSIPPELGCDARNAQVLAAAYSKGLSMNDIA